jgi:hypothetical protein
MTPEELRAVANRMANSLGISLYINDGRIHQTGPGEHFAVDEARAVVLGRPCRLPPLSSGGALVGRP